MRHRSLPWLLVVALSSLACEAEQAPDPCAQVTCDAWKTCQAGSCALASGRCDIRDDCGAAEVCSADHSCVAESTLCYGVACGHGHCVVSDGDTSCACDPAYQGDGCDACAPGFVPVTGGTCVADPCTTSPCGAHGACAADPRPGAAVCTCSEGWAGALCDGCASDFYAVGSGCFASIQYAIPMDRALVSKPVIGFDHNPATGTWRGDCLSYDGSAFPHCYDGHNGSDFILTGGFTTMDAGSTPVLAAADGVVIATHDGEYDRCQADIVTQDVVCGDYGYVTPANYVKLLHADGRETWYWHMKKDSVLVAVGDTVTCGQALGLIGSSGYSSMPHVHFGVRAADGTMVDPFAGAYSQPDSMWVTQDAGDGLPGSTCQGF